MKRTTEQYLVTHVGTEAASARVVQILLDVIRRGKDDFFQNGGERSVHGLVLLVQVNLDDAGNDAHLLLPRNVHQVDQRLYE